jgi:hypothetical protein
VQFRGEVNIGFVERDKEEGEDLVDFDEDDLGLLVVFWMERHASAIDLTNKGMEGGAYHCIQHSTRSLETESCTSGISSI